MPRKKAYAQSRLNTKAILNARTEELQRKRKRCIKQALEYMEAGDAKNTKKFLELADKYRDQAQEQFGHTIGPKLLTKELVIDGQTEKA